MIESNENISIQAVEQGISRWEEAVHWIEKGWDYIEEYTNDLSPREVLAEAVDTYTRNCPLPRKIISRIETVDQKFIMVTEGSDLCVWHCDCQFRYYNGSVELCFEKYDTGQYWYYYRWQPDCPYNFREYDSLAWQKEFYGMDFESMSEAELKEAARKVVPQWSAWIAEMKNNRT